MNAKGFRDEDGNAIIIRPTDVTCEPEAGTVISLTQTAAKADELETALEGKADVVHTHAIADVAGLQDALNGKANRIFTLRIDADASGDPATYPMTSTADALLSAFVDGVSANTEVPVLVKLYERSTSLGTVIGVAKWTLEGQEDDHDVTIRFGRLLFSTSRQFDGQQQWGTFIDWTKTSSQDIDEFFS